MSSLLECLEAVNATDQQVQDLVDNGFHLNSLQQFRGVQRSHIVIAVKHCDHWTKSQAMQLAAQIKPEKDSSAHFNQTGWTLYFREKFENWFYGSDEKPKVL
eukprot:248644_1